MRALGAGSLRAGAAAQLRSWLLRAAVWRRLLPLLLLIWCVSRVMVLFPGDTWKERLQYRVAVLREPGDTIITRDASGQPDSAFTTEQKSAIAAAFHWATTPTTRCQRQATFGGQPYASPNFETRIIEGDRPVCLDEGFSIANANTPCVVYSFGINNDWSFDDAMARFGCEVHAFDPSIGDQPARRPSGVHFHAIGIGRNDHVNVYGWTIRTLDSVMRELGHAELPRLQYLKVDGEGAEFDMLSQQVLDESDLRALDRFDQIGVEVHFRKDPEREMEFYSRLANVTTALGERGWAVAESVPNKIYNVWFRFPGVAEPVSHMFDLLLLNRQLVPASTQA